MRAKIFSIAIICVMMVSLLSGCNLFATDYPSYLAQTVASVNDGTQTVSLSKEELINGLNNYSSTLQQNGYSGEGLVDYVVNMLLQRKILLNYIYDNAAQEVADGAAVSDYQWELTNSEYNAAVQSTWDYINTQIETKGTSIYGDKSQIFLDAPAAASPAYDPQTVYTPTFDITTDSAGNITSVCKYTDPNAYVAPDDAARDDTGSDANSVFTIDNYKQYEMPSFVSSVVADKVWNGYISDLKNGQKVYQYSDMSEDAVFTRELNRVFKINLENAYLTKFQNNYTNNYSFDENGNLTLNAANDILNYYKQIYNGNVAAAAANPSGMSGAVEASNALGNYFYYGNSENYFTVTHILINFSDTQNARVQNINNGPGTPAEKAQAVADVQAPDRTFVDVRDPATGNPTGKQISATTLGQILYNVEYAAKIHNTYNGVLNQAGYSAEVLSQINTMIYQYCEDPGIINSTFDYVIGTQTSTMVDEFTDASRVLYDNGNGIVGNIYGYGDKPNTVTPVESTYGYHFIVYTGALIPLVQNANDITLTRLNTPLKASGGQTYLEYVYSKAIAADYNTYEAQLVAGLSSGLHIIYYKSTYSDLYS